MSAAACSPAGARRLFNDVACDRIWWLCVAAGPVVWLMLLALGMDRPSGWPSASTLVYGVLLYPALEEIVFRGLLQSMLLQYLVMQLRIGPISLANVTASLAFAASHLIYHSPVHAASVLLPSLVFGYVYERYRQVLPCILLHAFYNAGFLCLFAS